MQLTNYFQFPYIKHVTSLNERSVRESVREGDRLTPLKGSGPPAKGIPI